MPPAKVGEVSLREDGVCPVNALSRHHVLVCLRYARVVEGCTPAVEHVAEDACLPVGAEQLSHVGQWLKHLLGDVDVAVLADLVLGEHLCVVDVHVACHSLLPHELGEVVVGDAVTGEVLAGEVYHHRERAVCHEVEPVASLLRAEAAPVVCLLVAFVVVDGDGVAVEVGDGVGGLNVGVASHVLSSDHVGALAACEVLHHDGVVEHAGVDEQLLLRGAEALVVDGCVPRVVLGELRVLGEEVSPRVVVGHEDGLGACLREDVHQPAVVVRILRVVHVGVCQQPEVVGVVTARLEACVDARVEPRGLLVIECVLVLAGRRDTAGCQQDEYPRYLPA